MDVERLILIFLVFIDERLSQSRIFLWFLFELFYKDLKSFQKTSKKLLKISKKLSKKSKSFQKIQKAFKKLKKFSNNSKSFQKNQKAFKKLKSFQKYNKLKKIEINLKNSKTSLNSHTTPSHHLITPISAFCRIKKIEEIFFNFLYKKKNSLLFVG
ncbi:hypothetical protein ACKWTF_000637 [Chironomus riparius]